MQENMNISSDDEASIAFPALKREQTVDYNAIAAQYRQANWGSPSAPFHSCFIAASKKETQQAYTNAFQPRSGGFKSLFVNTQIPEKEKEEIVVLKKSETQHLSPTSKNRVLWENF